MLVLRNKLKVNSKQDALYVILVCTDNDSLRCGETAGALFPI